MLKSTINKGFTLVEMLVVLAIIAILGSITVPKLIKYIQEAQVAGVVETVNSLRTASTAYLKDNGSFAGLNAGTITTANAGNTLVAKGYLDGLPNTPLAGTGSTTLVKVASSIVGAAALADGSFIGDNYDFDGDGATDIGSTVAGTSSILSLKIVATDVGPGKLLEAEIDKAVAQTGRVALNSASFETWIYVAND